MYKERTDNKNKGKREEKTRYIPKRRPCPFCRDKIETIDYKDSAKLTQFISSRGKIEPRRRSGSCAKHQRALATAIKRARHLALLPFAPEHIYKMGGLPGPVQQAAPPSPPATPPPAAK
jgi:small subunit ribosomal protein S18